MALATDDFNRADGDLSGNWTQYLSFASQFIEIVSNEVRCDAVSSYAMAGWNANAFNSDQYSQAVVTNNAQSFGLACRIQTGQDRLAYIVLNAFGDLRLERLDGSSGPFTTLLDSVADPIVNGDVLRIEAEGTTIRVKRNGVEVLSATDATYAGGEPGIFMFNATARMDDWEGGDLVQPVPATPLDLTTAGSGKAKREALPWWWRSFHLDLPKGPPRLSDDEIEARERKRARSKARAAELAQELEDEAERKAMRAAARDERRSYDDRFANAFELAIKDGWKWPKQ